MSSKRPLRRLLIATASVAALYVAVAYLVVPAAWTRYERQPGLASLPMVTRTGQGIPGDPINVGLVGDREAVVKALVAAGWRPADPLSLRSSIEIVGSVLLDRPYRHAPVSNLYYDGRREDLAFEKEDGRSADRRGHVRLWRVLEKGAEGRPVWLGAATFDAGVELSRTTGQVTHRIAPDVDAERRALFDDLAHSGVVEAMYRLPGAGATEDGRNGEGDRYRTDGDVWVMRLTPGAERLATPPDLLDDAPPPAWLALWRTVSGGSGR